MYSRRKSQREERDNGAITITSSARSEATTSGSYCRFGKVEQTNEARFVELKTAQMTKTTNVASRDKRYAIWKNSDRHAAGRYEPSLLPLWIIGTMPPFRRSSWLTTTWGTSYRMWRLGVLNGRSSMTAAPSTKATGPSGNP